METLTGYQRDLLLVVAGLAPTDANEISDEMTDYRGDAAAAPRKLFPNLQTLSDRGLVDSDPITEVYEITDQGRTVVSNHREWRAELLDEE